MSGRECQPQNLGQGSFSSSPIRVRIHAFPPASFFERAYFWTIICDSFCPLLFSRGGNRENGWHAWFALQLFISFRRGFSPFPVPFRNVTRHAKASSDGTHRVRKHSFASKRKCSIRLLFTLRNNQACWECVLTNRYWHPDCRSRTTKNHYDYCHYRDTIIIQLFWFRATSTLPLVLWATQIWVISRFGQHLNHSIFAQL